MVEFLVNFTNMPNAPDNFGDTPIHYAAEYGYLDIIKILLKFNYTPNVPNIQGLTPIALATERGHLIIVKFLAHLELSLS